MPTDRFNCRQTELNAHPLSQVLSSVLHYFSLLNPLLLLQPLLLMVAHRPSAALSKQKSLQAHTDPPCRGQLLQPDQCWRSYFKTANFVFVVSPFTSQTTTGSVHGLRLTEPLFVLQVALLDREPLAEWSRQRPTVSPTLSPAPRWLWKCWNVRHRM